MSRRWPWLVSAALLVASAVATAWSVALHWQPCVAGRENDACLARMDSALPFPALSDASQEVPWASELGAVAMLLAAVSLVPVLVAAKVPRRPRLILAAAVVHPVLIGGLALRWALGPATAIEGRDVLPIWLWGLGDVVVVLAVLALLAWHQEWLGPNLVRILLLLSGVTAFGLFHMGIDYMLLMDFDTGPGTGVPTVIGLLLAAAGITVFTFLPPQPADFRTLLPAPART